VSLIIPISRTALFDKKWGQLSTKKPSSASTYFAFCLFLSFLFFFYFFLFMNTSSLLGHQGTYIRCFSCFPHKILTVSSPLCKILVLPCLLASRLRAELGVYGIGLKIDVFCHSNQIDTTLSTPHQLYSLWLL
jgi:hypothetical protein